MSPIITLLTDFGSVDSYVAEVRAVLLSHAHAAQVVDISHEVPPGDVRAAQYVLSRVWYRFPVGSVHLAVVDPGVGSDRRGVALRAADGRFLVGPDNGLLSLAAERAGGVIDAVDIGRSPFALPYVTVAFRAARTD